MTMKYAHIGIEDQAKALASLQTPWQGIGRDCTVLSGHLVAGSDSGSQDEATGSKEKSPEKNRAFDGSCQSESADAANDKKRRARGSNPQPLTGHFISNEAASHSPTLQINVVESIS